MRPPETKILEERLKAVSINKYLVRIQLTIIDLSLQSFMFLQNYNNAESAHGAEEGFCRLETCW